MTRGSRPPVLASFSGLYNNVHCKMYNNVQHCTSPLSSVGGQRATLSGASGMGLFDAATPLQKRKRNQRVAWLSAAKHTGEEPVGRPRDARDARTRQQHFTVACPCGKSVKVPNNNNNNFVGRGLGPTSAKPLRPFSLSQDHLDI